MASSQVVKKGSPSLDELEELSNSVGTSWKSLARRLGFHRGEIIEFHKDNEEYAGKALQMLVEWKERNGSGATYEALYQALCNPLCKRKTLAETFCCTTKGKGIGLKRKKVEEVDVEVKGKYERSSKKPKRQGLKRKKVEEGDAEVKGKYERSSKKQEGQAKRAMVTEEEKHISAGSRLHEEMRPSTSSGTAQSHGVRSSETFIRQEVEVESEEEVEVVPEEVIGVHVVTEEVTEVESEQATEAESNEEIEVEPDEGMEVEYGKETEVKGDYTVALSSSVIVFKNTVTKQGSHWNLEQVAAHVIFPPGAVSEDRTVTVSRWNPLACSPPLQDNEALVSDVIQLSTDSPAQFNEAVTLAVSHCAADLKGYEIVVKKLIDRDSNDWDDILETVDLRSPADIMKGLASPSNIPDYLLPVAEIKITQCSTFVVVCRLKSHEFILSSKGKVLSLPEYPLFKVFIPENAIQEGEELRVTVKLQEIPQKAFKRGEALVGPILRVTGSKPVEFQKPVTIWLPLSLTEGKSYDITDLSMTRVRIFFQESDTGPREWVEITSEPEMSPFCDGTVVKFSVKHFSVFWSWIESLKNLLVRSPGEYRTESTWKMVHFAAFVPRDTRLGKKTNLRLYCIPSNKREEMRTTEKNEGNVLLQVHSSSYPMDFGEKAYVFLPSEDVIKPVKKESLQELCVSFLNDTYCTNIKVYFVSRGDQTVEYYRRQEQDQEQDVLLCKMEVTLPPHLGDLDKTPVEFIGLPVDDEEDKPSDQVLNKVACHICAHWQNLGLELQVPNSKVQEILLDHALYPSVQQKAFQVLKAWKNRGKSVTYDELCRALNELGLNELAESLRKMQRNVNWMF